LAKRTNATPTSPRPKNSATNPRASSPTYGRCDQAVIAKGPEPSTC
jgi:hypothetical protein